MGALIDASVLIAVERLLEQTPVVPFDLVARRVHARVAAELASGGVRAGERDLLEREVAGAHAFPCDVADAAQVAASLDAVRARLGTPSVLVHNAVGGAFGTFLDVDPAVLEHNFRVNVLGLLHLARALAPAMIAAGDGAIMATGNTSALRGKAPFAGFAPTKAAQRILAESMARDLGPKGVHVAYVVIDAVIDVPWTRRMYPAAPDDFFIRPDAIADEIWHVVHQDRSAWSFNVELRPFGETW